MGDIVAARTRVVYLGHELELEHSLESKTGFKGVREVRGNKEGARFQAKVYVQGQAGASSAAISAKCSRSSHRLGCLQRWSIPAGSKGPPQLAPLERGEPARALQSAVTVCSHMMRVPCLVAGAHSGEAPRAAASRCEEARAS